MTPNMTAPDRREGGNVLVFPDTDNNFFHNSSWSDFPSASKDFTPQIPKRVAPRRRNSMIETYSSHSDVFGSDVLTADPWVDFTDEFGMSQHGKGRDESFRDESFNTSETFSDSSENDDGDFDPDFPSAEKPESGELGTMPLRDHTQKAERSRGRVSRGRQGRRGPRIVSSDEVGQKQPRRNRSRSKPSMVIGRRTRSLSVPKKAPASEFTADRPLSSHSRKPPPEDPFAEAEAENESKKKSKGSKSAKSKKEKPSKSPKTTKKSSKDKSDKSAKEPKDKSLKAPKASRSRSKSPKSPRDKSPKVPKSSRSKSPRAERSKSSRSKSPRAERRSKSPRAGRRSKSPRAERSKSPRVPRDKSPKVPKSSRSKSPKSPRDKTPKIPKPSRSKSPKAGRSKSPKSSRSKSPKSSRSKSPKSIRDRSKSSRDKSLKINEEDKSGKSQVTEVSSPPPKASKQTVAGSEKKKAQSLFASPLPPKSYLSRGTQKRCYAGVSKEIDQRKFDIKESLANLLSDEDKSLHRTILDDDDVESTGSAPRERKRSSSLPKRTGSDSSRTVQEVESAHVRGSKPHRRYRRHSIIGASRIDLEDDPKNCMVRPKSAESLMGTSGHSQRSKH